MTDKVELMHSFTEWRRLHQIVETTDADGEPTIKFVFREKSLEETPPLRIVVLPAAFNPLTKAHVELLDAAEGKKGIDESLLVLDKKTIDKELFGATLEDRLLMLESFARDRKNTSVAFSSHGLFLGKARALRDIYPEETEIFFIVGYDTLVRLFDPKYYRNRDEALEHLFSMSRFLVGNRAGSDESSVGELLSAPGNVKFSACVEPIRISGRAAAMSSTEVRERVEKGLELGNLAPESIEKVIRGIGLYSEHVEATSREKNHKGGRYEVRCDILRRLASSDFPEGRDLHIGKMVEEVMEGAEVGRVVENALERLR